MSYRGPVAGGGPRRFYPIKVLQRADYQETDATNVYFNSDPDGSLGYGGVYHAACSKVFKSLARVINMNPWARS
jgi:hypothetical protein